MNYIEWLIENDYENLEEGPIRFFRNNIIDPLARRWRNARTKDWRDREMIYDAYKDNIAGVDKQISNLFQKRQSGQLNPQEEANLRAFMQQRKDIVTRMQNDQNSQWGILPSMANMIGLGLNYHMNPELDPRNQQQTNGQGNTQATPTPQPTPQQGGATQQQQGRGQGNTQVTSTPQPTPQQGGATQQQQGRGQQQNEKQRRKELQRMYQVAAQIQAQNPNGLRAVDQRVNRLNQNTRRLQLMIDQKRQQLNRTSDTAQRKALNNDIKNLFSQLPKNAQIWEGINTLIFGLYTQALTENNFGNAQFYLNEYIKRTNYKD